MRILLLSLLLSLTPLAADALPKVKVPGTADTTQSAPTVNGRPVITSREAARIARAQNGGGRVLGVKLRGDVYKVKLLRDGEVSIVNVPARR